MKLDESRVVLPRTGNQAKGLAEYAIDFCTRGVGNPSSLVLHRTALFHTDSVACGMSALAEKTNAPNVLREEALRYPAEGFVTCFGSTQGVLPEKAVLANCSAVREWDSNGTNFGFDPARGNTAGEFGHNDFYPVVIAAAQRMGWDGGAALRAMVCLDEIRGRLAEVFSLKSYSIDHVVHGGIASAAVYGAIVGATPEQIESAIGMLVAHYVPFRAIRAGHQLSDSKGSSAAITAEMAVVCVQRSMSGFIGPADIFRNPKAIFRLFEPSPSDSSPFDLSLATVGDDFCVMGMHFKLGLYEHQSAGAIQAVVDLLRAHPGILQSHDQLKAIRIRIYEPAFGIIGDPAKRDPQTRQSADHSMVYIVATLIRKAIEQDGSNELSWKELMLLPEDYSSQSLFHSLTRKLMQRIEFVHGGDEYDARYPDGIPTTVEIDHANETYSSPLVMYPIGHARNDSGELESLLEHKFRLLLANTFSEDEHDGSDASAEFLSQLGNISMLSSAQLQTLYTQPIRGISS